MLNVQRSPLLLFIGAQSAFRGGGVSGHARGDPDRAEALQALPASAAVDCSSDELYWKAFEDMKTLALYRDHLKRFPTCAFATLAAARIEQLTKK